MKRLLLLILVVPFLFCSCGKEKKPPLPQLYFDAVMAIDYNQNSFEAQISTAQNGEMTFTINSPQELSGLTYKYLKNSLSIEYSKLKCETNDGYLPNHSLAQLLYNSFLSFSQGDYEFVEFKDSKAVFKLTCDGEKYFIYTDENSGQILKIDTENSLLTATFSYK